MHRHVRPCLAYQHDQPRVSHDQGVGLESNHRGHVVEVGFDLGVMRHDVAGDEEFLAQAMSLGDTFGQVFQVEIVIAHAQGVARLTGIHRICAIGKGVVHVFQGAGGQ